MLVVGGVAVYLRFVKGWKLSDLMYVTRASLSNLSESMKQSEWCLAQEAHELASVLLCLHTLLQVSHSVQVVTGMVFIITAISLPLGYYVCQQAWRTLMTWGGTSVSYMSQQRLTRPPTHSIDLPDCCCAGMDKVRNQLEARAAEMMERMHVLGSKQEEMLEAQGELGNELAVVGGKISAVSEQVGFSNHAILLLCGALSEMAKRVGISNGKYVRELEHLSRTVATTGLPAGVTTAMLPMGPPVSAAVAHQHSRRSGA